MPNVGTVLREEITRLSRREIRKQTEHTKKSSAQHRHDIAALNRKVVELERKVAQLTRQVSRPQHLSVSASGNGSTASKIRFVAKGLRSHRNRVGLSAGDFGKLLGVSANSVYAWESGVTTPRREQVAKIAQVRGIGKREALKRLEAARATKSRPRRKP